MKLLKMTLLIITLLCAFSISQSQDLWENINLPDGLNSDITCIVTDGDEMFIGTNMGGIHYSSNKGRDWTHLSHKLIDQDIIQNIFISPNGYIFAVGEKIIYRSNRKQFSWEAFNFFQQNQEVINCSDMSIEGDLAVGTDNGIYKSSAALNGSQWSNITGNLEKIKVTKVKFDALINLFICTYRKEQYSIFILQTRNWEEIVGGIKHTPNVNHFALDQKQNIFAAIGIMIYEFDYRSKTWSSLPESGQRVVRKIKFSKQNNLISISDYDIKIFDREKNNWSNDNDDMNFKDRIVDLIIDSEDRIISVTIKEIKITDIDIAGIIDWLLRKKFKVYDAKNNLVTKTTFSLYKGSCDNNAVYLTDVTTNSSGTFSIDEKSLGLSTGDQLKLEKSITGLNSAKTGHEAVNNRMYEIRLNNLKFNGDGQPSYYVLTTDEYQNIKMDHTQLLFNLVISVEWDAKQEYLDTLKSWIKSMSSFLWDVTDGHLYIKKVAIYDNKQKWDKADIRIFVSNVVWPNASVAGIKENDAADAHANIPRRWYGNGDMSRNRTALSNWISESDNLFLRASSTTIAHELGHYLFGFWDEYVWVDTNKQKTVPSGYNFGFMQYQYSNGGVYSSEMSFPGRYSNDNWKYTAQWAYNGSDCWTQFEKEWEKTYVTTSGGFFCPINKPSERTLSSGRDYLLGPLDFNSGQTQCRIDPLVEVHIFNESISSGDVNITCIDDESQIVKKADTYLSLPSSFVMIPINYQGKTSDDGKIKVLGAKVGQSVAISCVKRIYLPLLGYINVYYYKFYNISSVSSSEKETNEIVLEDQIVKLERVKGDFRFINSLQYDTKGQLNFSLFSKSQLSEIPIVVITDEKNEAVYFPTRYNEKSISYSSQINYNLGKEGIMQLSLKDEENNSFFVPLHYSISDRKEKMLAPLGSAELTFDPKNSEFRTVAFLISDFFPITEGLAREPEHVGKVLSIASYPEDFQQGSNNLLMMRYNRSDLILKDELSLKIHRWEENSRKWIVFPSTVDSTEQMVTCLISQNGIYALFTTDLTTGYDDIDDKNHFGLRVSPNPITNEAEIQFAMNNPEFVNLSLIDSFGRDVLKVISEYKQSGIHKVKININSLTSGVYYIRLKSGISTSIVKAVVIK